MSHNWIRNKQPLSEAAVSGSTDEASSRSPEHREDALVRSDDPNRQIAAKETRHAHPGAISQQWEMRLIFVDDNVTITLLSRLLATEPRMALLDHPMMSDIRQDIQQTRIPPDLNSALIATRLLEIGGALIFDIDDHEGPYMDQPVRLEGTIKKVDSGSDPGSSVDLKSPGVSTADLCLHIKMDNGADSLLLLSRAVSYGWTTPDLQDRRILAIGLLRRPRDRVVIAAAVMQLERFGETS